MRVILILLFVGISSLLHAQTPDVQPVKNWMGIAQMGSGKEKQKRLFVRTNDGKLKYFDVMRNLQDFEGISNVTQIVSNGLDYILALKDDGTVWAWGNNEYGQLGNRDLVERRGKLYSFRNSDKPVQVTGLSDVIEVSAYQNTSYALKTDGTVWAWGNARSGLTGNGKPVLHYMTTVTESYTVSPEKVVGISDVIAIHGPMALLSNGTVWTWGQNNYGQLGNKGAEATSTPQQVAGLTNVSAICSNIHGMRMVLKADGTLWSWGENRNNKTGHLQGQNVETPRQVNNIAGGAIMVAGHSTNLLLTTARTVMGWGDGSFGALGTRINTGQPQIIPTIKNAVGIYAAVSAGFALLADGSIMAWGAAFRAPDKNATPIKIADLGKERPH